GDAPQTPPADRYRGDVRRCLAARRQDAAALGIHDVPLQLGRSAADVDRPVAGSSDRHRLLDRRAARTAAGCHVHRDGAAIGAPAERGRVIVSAGTRTGGTRATATAFAALFAVVGLSLYGLPLYYDFMVNELGWSRLMVTSGNAISKLIVGPLFGFAAGWIVDRFGPRRLMMTGIVMAGGALVGLGAVSAAWAFYFFYFFNALGYVCGGPLPSQVLLSRWFDRTRG